MWENGRKEQMEDLTTQPSENANAEDIKKTAEVETKEDDAPPTRNEKEEARTFYQQRQLAKKTVDEDIAPDDQELIKKVVDTEYGKKIDSLLAIQQQQQDEKEISEIKAKYPQLEAHFNKAESWWKHESRRNIPFKSVLFEVAGDDLLNVGAEMERNAQTKSNQTKVAGSTNKGVSTSKPISEMSSDEFSQTVNKIISG